MVNYTRNKLNLGDTPLKSFQIRLSDDLKVEVDAIADRGQQTVASVIRNALDFRAQSEPFARAGYKLVSVDEVTGERTILIIPGFTSTREKK